MFPVSFIKRNHRSPDPTRLYYLFQGVSLVEPDLCTTRAQSYPTGSISLCALALHSNSRVFCDLDLVAGVIDTCYFDEDIAAEGDRLGGSVDPLAGACAVFDGLTAFDGRSVLGDDLHIQPQPGQCRR